MKLTPYVCVNDFLLVLLQGHVGEVVDDALVKMRTNYLLATVSGYSL